MSLPSLPGTYVLVIEVTCRLMIEGPFNEFIPEGIYIYAGSALGPGGLRARITRHFSSRKKVRWHIDYLTGKVPPLLAVYTIHPGKFECALVKSLLKEGFSPVLEGFGASDCREGCPSHLLRWPGSIQECIEGIFNAFTSLGLNPVLYERGNKKYY